MNTSCPSFIMLLYVKIHSFELIIPDFFIQMHCVADNLQAVQYVHLGYGRSCYVIHLLNDIFSTQHLPHINDLKSFCKNNYWISPNLNLSSFCFVNRIHVMPRSTTLILTYFSLSFRYGIVLEDDRHTTINELENLALPYSLIVSIPTQHRLWAFVCCKSGYFYITLIFGQVFFYLPNRVNTFFSYQFWAQSKCYLCHFSALISEQMYGRISFLFFTVPIIILNT